MEIFLGDAFVVIWPWEVKIVNLSKRQQLQEHLLGIFLSGLEACGVTEPQLECTGTLAFPALSVQLFWEKLWT